jgi:hypothetical protein
MKAMRPELQYKHRHQPQGCHWRREQLRPRRVGGIAANGDSHCHGLESAARNFDNTYFTFNASKEGPKTISADQVREGGHSLGRQHSEPDGLNPHPLRDPDVEKRPTRSCAPYRTRRPCCICKAW